MMPITTTDLTLVCCSNDSGRGCGRWFGMLDEVHAIRSVSKETWWCPYCGLTWRFGKDTEFQRIKAELERKTAEIARLDQRLAAERAAKATEERRANALKGHLGHMKRRIGNGVCPCCKRSFANVRRHMASKHPGYKNEET